ncbi:hypothetical protein [Microbacterium sp. 1.5R]|uniref:hypothetical protein n=1 Tax=Microbacterium sp. 1.5R TaxID=1916917 RepID=UPI0016434147|nr:hypothetical protein [Microbacterium sp. 1.5R]
MVIVIALLVLSAWALIATVVELRRDGYRRQPTDWRQVAGRDALGRARSGHVYR